MERPKVGVGVFIRRQGKILLGKRMNAHGHGTWCPPGGHLEFFETFEDCAKREVLEETGLFIDSVNFAMVTNDMFKEEKKHYVTIFVTSTYVSGDAKVMEPGKCEQWGWFSWDDLPQPLFLALDNLIKSGFSPFD